MESWRDTWRRGFVPGLAPAGLEALLAALERDDPRLTQGSTTTPPPLGCVQDWPCEAADALAFCGWQGGELATVGEVEEFFARACFEADQRLGEHAACRYFLNFWDDTPRRALFRDLAAEVRFNLGAGPDPLTHPDETAFQAALDADPDEQTIRSAFADWLEDRGDSRAAGYRALAALGREPGHVVMNRDVPDARHDSQWVYGRVDNHPHTDAIKYATALLPLSWFAALPHTDRVYSFNVDKEDRYWEHFDARRAAEDAAALAFAGLPPEEKEKILAGRLHQAAS